VFDGGTKQSIVVFGGFAEVSPRGLTLLADVAMPVADVDQAALAAQIKDLEESVAKLKTDAGSALDREIERLDHFRTVQQHLTGTAMH
jgi:F-type H+-transporting ATPase subunit epsilon